MQSQRAEHAELKVFIANRASTCSSRRPPADVVLRLPDTVECEREGKEVMSTIRVTDGREKERVDAFYASEGRCTRIALSEQVVVAEENGVIVGVVHTPVCRRRA